MNKNSATFKAYALFFTTLLIVASASSIVLVAYDIGGLIFAFVTAHCPHWCVNSSKCNGSDTAHVLTVIFYFISVIVSVGLLFILGSIAKEGFGALYDKVWKGL